MTRATAFSTDFLVMMSRGFRSTRIASTSTRADSAAESAFSRSGDAICDEPSRLMPSASNEDDIVFAVYWPPQCAHRRAGVFLDAVEIFLRHLTGGERVDGLERAHDGELLSFPKARLDGAGVHKDSRYVHARHRHYAPRHVLVAATDRNHPVHTLAVDRDFNCVGNDFARYQRILHALGTHADAISH